MRLAHQFGNSDRTSCQTDAKIGVGQVRPAVLNAARLPYALCVGTIELQENCLAPRQCLEERLRKLR